MPQRQRPLMLDLFHDTLHQGRLTLAILPDESDLIPSLDHQISVSENRMIAIRFRDILDRHRIRARTGRRRKLQAQSRGIFLIHLQDLQFLQHLHTALHLQGLGVRALETLDELSRLGDHLLLLVISLLLLLTTFLP